MVIRSTPSMLTRIDIRAAVHAAQHDARSSRVASDDVGARSVMSFLRVAPALALERRRGRAPQPRGFVEAFAAIAASSPVATESSMHADQN